MPSTRDVDRIDDSRRELESGVSPSASLESPVLLSPPPASNRVTEGIGSDIVDRVIHLTPSMWSFLLSVVSVACWAVAGNAARISLSTSFQHHDFYPRFDYFGPNTLGSFAMGFFQGLLPAEVQMPWLHRGLCGGFCGCFTTLSSWVLNVVNATSVRVGAEELISGVALPVMFFLVGGDLAEVLRPPVHCLALKWTAACFAASSTSSTSSDKQPTEPVSVRETVGEQVSERLYLVVDSIVLALAVCSAVGIPTALYVTQHYHRSPGGLVGTMSSDDLRNALLAPCGAVPRFLAGYLLNKHTRWSMFPVGTFMSNTAAVVLAMVLYRLEYNAPASSWGYPAVLTGVCGALSTVSSFVSETVGFYKGGRAVMAYGYAVATLGLTLVIAGVGRQENYR